jgi:RNA polymerase sigma-70 factor (ECF subfamily)
MNLLLATECEPPESLLHALMGYVAARIAGVRREFGLRTMAANDDDAIAQAKDRSRQSSSMASASDAVSAGRPSTSANDQYGRFQREIVPHLDAAYNFARFLSRNPDAAQDIVQEAFLRAYRRFDGYQGGDARAWIFSIVRNCYHNWLLEGRRKARHVLNKLPRSLREVLVLRELEGLSYRQMAETLALPIGTVMSRLARGRTQFEIAWRAEAAVQEKQR